LAEQGLLGYPLFGISLTQNLTGSLSLGAIDASIVTDPQNISWNDVAQFSPFSADGMIIELGPGVRKLVPNVQEKSVKLAEDYLKIQIRRQWPSDFLTSDLMPNLAIADGVEPQYQKAQL